MQMKLAGKRLLLAVTVILAAGCCTPASKPTAEPAIGIEKPDIKSVPDIPGPDTRAARRGDDRQRLAPHFAKQETPYSCSMASARMVIAGLTGKKVSEAGLRKQSRVGKDGMTVSKLAALLRGRPYRLQVDK